MGQRWGVKDGPGRGRRQARGCMCQWHSCACWGFHASKRKTHGERETHTHARVVSNSLTKRTDSTSINIGLVTTNVCVCSASQQPSVRGRQIGGRWRRVRKRQTASTPPPPGMPSDSHQGDNVDAHRRSPGRASSQSPLEALIQDFLGCGRCLRWGAGARHGCAAALGG